jgi:putative addiction module killer protein
MFEVRQTAAFDRWLENLPDLRGREIIAKRIVRMQSGLLGDVEPVGEGVSEMRVNHGPGYRLYFVRRGKILFLLLCGGDKASQERDIKKAKKLAKTMEA